MGKNYSDKELRDKTQALFLETAGFVIKFSFGFSESVFFKRKLLEQFETIWGKGGFLRNKAKEWDFEILFKSGDRKIEVIEKQGGKRHYHLAFRRNFSSKKVEAFYHLGLPAIQALLREVVSFLLLENGLMLHASSCLDSKRTLHVFLAPQGGGKTTIADLVSQSKDFAKFSDDSVLLRKIKDKWVFFSPPIVEKYMLPVSRSADKALIYFIRKDKSASKKEIVDKNKILKFFLKQLWLRVEKIDKRSFSTALDFVAENDFYILKSVLNARVIRRVLK